MKTEKHKQKTKEEVVLVDEDNNVIKTMPKEEVHGSDTPLHRAFSSFIFRSDGKLLLQQRSHKKKTWPLVWSNSCCGHPALDESTTDAANRRLRDELGMSVDRIEEVSPYRYKFIKDGIMENEICPILVGLTSDEPEINSDEVENTKWVEWDDFLKEITDNPEKYSPWCVEQVKILQKNKRFKELIKQNEN